MTTPQDIIEFWFEQSGSEQWFSKDDAFDAQIRERFSTVYAQAKAGECWRWRESPMGRLAEIIVLDQFARNLFRDDARAFAGDGMALILAQEAVALGADKALPQGSHRAFLYMPYIHSESLAIHEVAMRLFDAPGLENNLKFEKQHRDIIQRFGRYPHRNAVLGRESTPEEIAFLQGPGSSF